jgi:hypothetical protein
MTSNNDLDMLTTHQLTVLAEKAGRGFERLADRREGILAQMEASAVTYTEAYAKLRTEHDIVAAASKDQLELFQAANTEHARRFAAATAEFILQQRLNKAVADSDRDYRAFLEFAMIEGEPGPDFDNR